MLLVWKWEGGRLLFYLFFPFFSSHLSSKFVCCRFFASPSIYPPPFQSSRLGSVLDFLTTYSLATYMLTYTQRNSHLAPRPSHVQLSHATKPTRLHEN